MAKIMIQSRYKNIIAKTSDKPMVLTISEHNHQDTLKKKNDFIYNFRKK